MGCERRGAGDPSPGVPFSSRFFLVQVQTCVVPAVDLLCLFNLGPFPLSIWKPLKTMAGTQIPRVHSKPDCSEVETCPCRLGSAHQGPGM